MFAQQKLDFITAPKDENATIWRYIDFTKFLFLLEKRALFFTSVSQLYKSDKFEGSIPKGNLKQRKQLLARVPDKLMRADVHMEERRININMARATYVNCWTCFKYEIAALWKLYIRSNEGIAIKSSYRRLKESIEKDKFMVMIGLVQYIDYDKDVLPKADFLNLAMHKRKSFQFERELRAMVIGWRLRGQSGIYVKADLEKLIDRIYISPQGENWFLDLVKSIVEKYDLKKPVKRSDLDTDPIY